ncbi:MAG: hypothetical protein ACR5K2_01965 [Wolbachia sp.]
MTDTLMGCGLALAELVALVTIVAIGIVLYIIVVVRQKKMLNL